MKNFKELVRDGFGTHLVGHELQNATRDAIKAVIDVDIDQLFFDWEPEPIGSHIDDEIYFHFYLHCQ